MSDKSIIAYFLGAYPGETESIELMRKSEAAGADIFEVGYPSFAPYADGDVIRSAHKAVLDNGMPDMGYWGALRKGISKPIWIMAYREGFVDNGIYNVFAEKDLADAFVLPDCTDEERAELQAEFSPRGIEILGFASPETPFDEFRKCLEHHRLIYFKLYVGQTGQAASEDADFSTYLKIALEYPDTKIYAGFGISTAEKSRALVKEGFDGVIIGTAFLKAMQQGEDKLLGLIKEISTAVRSMT